MATEMFLSLQSNPASEEKTTQKGLQESASYTCLWRRELLLMIGNALIKVIAD